MQNQKMKEFTDAHYDALGPIRVSGMTLMDHYRFKRVLDQLDDGSVLDVGAYNADFLKMAMAQNREVYGTEVNEVRVKHANKMLGRKGTVLDFRNGRLRTFEDNSVDNVVCMEVLEHVVDDAYALKELCRVARRRVIVTVPYRENIGDMLCVHCATYTPLWGHLRRYDADTFASMVSPSWEIDRQTPFAKWGADKIARLLRLPQRRVSVALYSLLDSIVPGRGRWLMVVLRNDGL